MADIIYIDKNKEKEDLLLIENLKELSGVDRIFYLTSSEKLYLNSNKNVYYEIAGKERRLFSDMDDLIRFYIYKEKVSHKLQNIIGLLNNNIYVYSDGSIIPHELMDNDNGNKAVAYSKWEKLN